MIKTRTGLCVSIAAVALAALSSGCQEPPDGEEASEAFVYRTVATIDDSGKLTSETRKISVAQREQEKRLRAAALSSDGNVAANIVVDFSCVASSMWLFDQPNLGGNELCLFMSPRSVTWDFANLSAFPRGPFGSLGTWSKAVRSLWAGQDIWAFWPGCFEGGCGCGGSAFQRADAVTSCVANGTMISLARP